MIRRALLGLVVASVLAPSLARAQVPPPVGTPPGPGDSPGTGGLPPIPPPPDVVTPGNPPADPPGVGGLPQIPPPSGRPTTPGMDNTPSTEWYKDMYYNIYYSNAYFQGIENWAYNEYHRTHDKDVYNLYA